ncbi:MAG: bifunctional diaminohydroxyphosphoribosylaminopyrimidine deaminase/5-amino-6-(5-phosphoribosylamino)uracil reductase RibD [Sediminibacterium sp.]|nr:bifunctional diaminohydroxyphosphoribosylaminopyrimidine deaminase/5-amino-6-(5-phosphoribosylamino)uracil reductase RibD [Sediminibacterium sp.]
MGIHEQYMARCIELALKGAGHVAPNPMVGAVLVYQNTIIGEGFHAAFGGPHAEVNCFNSVEEANRSFIKESTLYVSLEPCAHFGKTPPCANLIIQYGVKQLVIGCRDPFDAVNGKGIQLVEGAGIEVIEGILANECKELNKRFFNFHLKKQPYIILKWAQSANCKIAGTNRERVFISNELSNVLVHRWRSEEAAILVGTNTALNDNPSLNTRLWLGKSPLRLVLDTSLRLPNDLKIFTDDEPVTVFNYRKTATHNQVQYVQIHSNESIVKQIIAHCYANQIQSILVEGGARLLQSFIEEGYWNEARVITNEALTIEEGLDAPKLPLVIPIKEETLGGDQIQYFYNR